MKAFIAWNYERGTWQYDVFCLAIIAFIFLTPKSWFTGPDGRNVATQAAAVNVKAESSQLAGRVLDRQF